MVAMPFWVWIIEPHVDAVMTMFGRLIGQVHCFTHTQTTKNGATMRDQTRPAAPFSISQRST
jgi:hypothetical protein